MAVVVLQNGLMIRLHCGPTVTTMSADRPLDYSLDYGHTWKRLEAEHNVAVPDHVIVRKPQS